MRTSSLRPLVPLSLRPLVLCVAFLVVVTLAGPSAQSAREIPRLPVQQMTLPNGLKVIFSQDRRLPLVAVNLWYHVGPANEEPGRTGFAHLFEHLMFQGSKHVPGDSHFKLLQAAGATDVNGTTDFDRTNYFETVPANQLELALWIESDRMGYLLDTVDRAALANQQDVVRNERRQSVENQPYGVAQEAVVRLLYPHGHPVLRGRDRIARGYPSRQVRRREAVLQALLRAEQRQPGDRRRFRSRGGAGARPEVLRFAQTGPGGPRPLRTDAEDYVRTPQGRSGSHRAAAGLHGVGDIADLHGGRARRNPGGKHPGGRTLESPLQEAGVRAPNRPGRRRLQPGTDPRFAVPHSGDRASWPHARGAREGHRSGARGLSRAGARRARGRAGAKDVRDAHHFPPRRTRRLWRRRGPAQRLQPLPRHAGLSAEGHRAASQRDVGIDAGVRPRAVAAIRARRRVRRARHAGFRAAGSDASGGPSRSGEGAESVNADEPWRAMAPTPAAVRTYLQVPVPESARLSNGLTLILSRRRGLPVVAADFVVRTGSDSNPPDAPGLANFTVGMLDEGTATRSSPQIADDVAQLGATLNVSSSMDASTVSARALKWNFAAALDLAADVVLRPTFPAEEIERQRTARLGQLVQQRQNANALAAEVVANVLYGDTHPYGYTELGTEASVKTITRDRMLAFWKQNFVPNNAALIVAGDISMPELRGLAEKAFGSWQPGTPAQPSLGTPVPGRSKIVIVDRPGAPQTQLRVVTVGAARSSPDYRALQVMNTALGGLFSSRINMNLREEHGYTYGANSQFQFRKSAGPFVVASGIRTDVTAPAVNEVLKELRGIAAEAMPADELGRAKDALIKSLPGNFETSGDVTASLSNVYIYNLGLDYFSRYAESVNAIDPAQALAAAKKYLQADRLVVVAVGDRARIEPDLRKLDLPVEIRDREGKLIND